MIQEEAEEFFGRHFLIDYGRVVWNDDSEHMFPLAVAVEVLRKHGSPSDFLVAEILANFPKQSREDIREIWVADELWMLEDGRLIDNLVLPY